MSERKVKCPECGKPALFSPENPFRPFCSERCRLIDLGQWAEGKYAVPVGNATIAAEAADDSSHSPMVDEEAIEAEIAARLQAIASHSAHQSDDND